MRLILILLVVMSGVARAATAQEVKRWHATAAENASVLFGAVSQRIIASSLSLTRADSGLEASVNLQHKYGDSKDADGARFVSARSWLASVAFDAIPHERLTPFVFGSIESSLQKQLDRRSSGGAGGKWVFSRTPRGDMSISLALLGERTVPRARDTAAVVSTTVTRWSWRIKTKQKLGEPLTFEHTTFYQPVYNSARRYTVATTTALAYQLLKEVGLRVSVVDNYDSEARLRGARSNNDGQLLFGIQAGF